jgi:hypothetical protein
MDSGGFLVASGGDIAKRINGSAANPYWTPENGVTNAAGAYNSQPISGILLTSRSFVRLQDVSLAYNFNDMLLSKIGLSNTTIYFSGKNMITLTKWGGFDPEVYNKTNADPEFEDGSNSTPLMKSVVIGLNFSF